MSETAVATTSIKRQENILIAAPFGKIHRINAVKVQSICHGLQSPEGNAAVTLDASQRCARPLGSAATPHTYARTISRAVASWSPGEGGLCPRDGRWYSLRGESCESAEVHRVFS